MSKYTWTNKTVSAGRFSGSSLKCSAIGANLHTTNLVGAKVEGDFTDAVLHICDLRRIAITNSSFSQATLSLCDLVGASIEASFTGASFVNCRYPGSEFLRCDFSWCDFSKESVLEVKFTHCDFRNINYMEADFEGCTFVGCYNLPEGFEEEYPDNSFSGCSN